MKINDIFVIVEESLYAVQFDNEQEFLHSWNKYFELWNDPLYLYDFFEQHKDDLNHPFWKGITIEQAVLKTQKDAKILERKLKEVAETGKTEKYETLSTFFEPLSKDKIEEYEKDKAKGILKPSWLRIYAIRIDTNCFIITGGGIKLTKTMNDRSHLLEELNKLDFTRKLLLDGEDEIFDIVVFR